MALLPVIAMISHVASHYITQQGVVYDFGACSGDIGRALAPVLKKKEAALVSVEPEVQMALKARLQGPPPGDWVQRHPMTVELVTFDVAILNFCLVYMPVALRAGFISKLVNHQKPGGAIIIVDQISSPAGQAGAVLRSITQEWAVLTGHAIRRLDEKEKEGPGVCRPISPSIIPPTAHRFLQCGEFVGWILEKPEAGEGRL